MKKGDLVSAIDEDLEGRITKVIGDKIFVESDGFVLEYLKDQLILMPEKSIYPHVFSKTSAKDVIEEKEKDDKPFLKRRNKNQNDSSLMVVDLHEQHLNRSTKGKTKHEILNLQLDTARYKLEFAIKKSIQKIVFIHGVGEGVLKMELEYLLGRYENVKFYDADFKTYGFGATEVFIYQNS